MNGYTYEFNFYAKMFLQRCSFQKYKPCLHTMRFVTFHRFVHSESLSIVVVCQKCHFWEFLKKWSLQVNSVTRQATFDRTKNCWKTPKLEKLKCDILGNCQHCEPWYLNMLSCLLRLKMRLFRDYNTLCFLLYSTTFISIEKHLKNKWHLPK